MKLIVDANVLFSALIRDGTTRRLFFEDALSLYAPEFLMEEFAKHRGEILEKTGRSELEFEKVLSILRSRISFVGLEKLARFRKEALDVSPDHDDAAYFALALCLKDVTVWSNDNRLKNQKRVRVVSTSELLAMLGK